MRWKLIAVTALFLWDIGCGFICGGYGGHADSRGDRGGDEPV